MARRIANSHSPVREFRDPVHGFVKLTAAEVDVVNSPPFRRLRDIRQLAMGHMVYPGANHTRFEHSIGCLHLSTQIMDLLIERPHPGGLTLENAFDADRCAIMRGRKILRLASLLHDVGHPPFSHSGESLFPQGINHESMTARLIRESEIAQIINDHYSADNISPEDVIVVATSAKLANDKTRETAFNLFLNQILTGELGADRIDYLLRDAIHSGQPSGQFDYSKLMNAMTLVEQPEEEGEAVRLGLDEGGWLVAEQMVAARYLMYIALYFHKTKRIYEQHLTDFMREWLLPSTILPTSTSEFLRFTDSTVLGAIDEAGRDEQSKGHHYALRFVGRNHLRLAKEVILADNCVIVDGRRIPNKERFDKLEKCVRILSGIGPVVADTPDHSATKMFDEDYRILVLIDEKPRYLEAISEIVRGMSSKIWRGRIYCEKNHKVKVKAACEEFLSNNPPTKEERDGETT